MDTTFDHEKLRVYQEALRFVAWTGSLLRESPAKSAARENLDRASTSAVLNIAEGNGKRSSADRCRFLDIARGSALECAACLDVLVARKLLDSMKAEEGKLMLVGIVSMLAGLIARFSSPRVAEEAAPYGFDAIDGLSASSPNPRTRKSRSTRTKLR